MRDVKKDTNQNMTKLSYYHTYTQHVRTIMLPQFEEDVREMTDIAATITKICEISKQRRFDAISDWVKLTKMTKMKTKFGALKI